MGQDQSLPENHQVSHTNRARSLSPLPRDAEENSDDAAQFPATQPIPKKSKFLESPVAESDPADPMASPESRPRHRKRREDREDRRRRRSESFSATQTAADLERPSPSQEAEARPSTQPDFSEVKKKKKNKKKSKRHSLASQAVEEETSILDSNPIPESPTIAPHSSLFAALESSHQALQVNLEEQEQEQDHARPDFLDNFRAKSFGSGKKKRRSSQGSETSGVMAPSSLKKRDKEARKSNRRVDELERNQSDHAPAVMAKAPLPEDEDETMDYSRREEIDEEMDEDMPAGLPSFTQRSFLGANDPGSPVISESSLPELPRPIDNDQNVEYLDNYPEHSGDEEEEHEEEEHEEEEYEEGGADDGDRGDIGFGSPDLSRHKEREMSQVLDEDLSTKNIKATRRSPIPPASPEHAAEPDPVPPSSSARAPGSQSSRRLKKKVPFFERENQETSNLPSDPAADEADAPPHQLESSQPKSSRLKKQKKTRSEPRPEIIPESDIEETSVISKTQITNGGGSSQRSAPKSSQPSSRKSRPQPPPEISPESDIDEADAAPEAPTADGGRSSQRSTQKSSQKSSRKSKKSAPVVASSADDTKGHDESDSTGEREGQNERPTQASQYRTGVMTKSEITKIKRAIERFREDEGMTQTEVNTIIHENPQSKAGVKEVHQRLWARVVEACTTRPRKKLILWCRKNFHNFVARGRWTEEQDDELVELVKAHGNSWVKIASIINRHQDDVRDRWRNYLVCRDTVITDQWSVEEEERLTAAVENAIKKIQAKLDEQGKRDVSAEELVSWGLISDEMGRTRSRLQCQEKWKRLSMAEPIADREQVVTLLPPGNNGWRIKKARRDLRRIDLADKNKLVCAIRDSGAEHERDIVWKTIVTETFEKNYERQALVVVWGRLKQSVPDFKQKTVNQCAKQLAKMYRNEGNFGNQQQYDDGESSGDDATNRTRRNNSGNRPNSLKNSKSKLKSAAEVKKIKTPAEAISDEEDEEEEQGEMSVDNQDQEMEDAPPRTTPEVNDVSQLSPTFNSVPVSDSPSVAAEASRSRRRERSASVTASVAAATATVIAAPSPQRSKSKSRGKSRERQRRDRESDAVAAAPPKSPERPEPSTQEIPSSVKRSGKKRRLSSSGANGELWTGASVKKRERAAKKRMRLMKEVDTTGLSSDMDDMEDIPARTQESSQVL